MFRFENQPAKKTLLVELSGFFRSEDAQGSIAEYQSQIQKIEPSNTKLVIDATELKTSAQDMVPVMRGCLEMFIKDGFKEVEIVEPSQVVCSLQIKKIVSDLNHPKINMQSK